MIKKSFILLAFFLTLPGLAAYDPMSEEPINSVEEFYQESSNDLLDSEDENNEVEYTTPSTPVVESTKDYAGIYNRLELPKHSYLHDIDPDQYYDMKDATWAPYPLLRLNSYIYFKDRAIEPG